MTNLFKNIWRYRIKPYLIPGLIIVLVITVLSLLGII
jgi:hypothetical protein